MPAVMEQERFASHINQ